MDIQDFKGEFSQGSFSHVLPPPKTTLDLLLYISSPLVWDELSLLLSKSPSVLSRILYFSRAFCIFNYSLSKDITPLSPLGPSSQTTSVLIPLPQYIKFY